MLTPKQKIDGDGNNTAGRDLIKIYQTDEESDFGIIDEIIEYVCLNAENDDTPKSRAEDLTETKKKIDINFKTKEDVEEVQEYFSYAYTKLSYVEEKFAGLFTEDQNDIHAYLLNEYRRKKSENLSNIEILRHLFDFVIPKNKKSNPRYKNSSHAFILLFFDDCTIFEKTEKQKKDNVKNLFS